MGSWQVLPYQAPILPVHAALLNTGKVFFSAGSGNDPSNTTDADLLNADAVLDLTAGTFNRPNVPLNAFGHPLDVFCAGHAFGGDGKLMVIGGTLQYDPFYGLSTALLFDPATETWSTTSAMSNGRWYPTLLSMGNGSFFALGGNDTNGLDNRQPEVYPPSTGSWSAYPVTSNFPDYANLILLANGNLFYSGACMGGNNGVPPRVLVVPSPGGGSITETPVWGLSSAYASDQATTVLLPPAQNQKVMILGGGGGGGSAVNRVAIADFTARTPAYRTASPLKYARMHLSAVILPDRTVFVCNGSQMSEKTNTSMLPAEVYDPYSNRWSVAETPTVPRVYHSVALLLPDGSVLTAGGNPVRGTNELRLERYTPSYMSRSRPIIQSAPATANYGASITVQTSQAPSIQWVSLIRPSANTHSCDTEQRLVDLPITSRTSTSLTVSVTTNSNLAPPGYYMLFLTDTSRTPSTASWVQLS